MVTCTLGRRITGGISGFLSVTQTGDLLLACLRISLILAMHVGHSAYAVLSVALKTARHSAHTHLIGRVNVYNPLVIGPLYPLLIGEKKL